MQSIAKDKFAFWLDIISVEIRESENPDIKILLHKMNQEFEVFIEKTQITRYKYDI